MIKRRRETEEEMENDGEKGSMKERRECVVWREGYGEGK